MSDFECPRCGHCCKSDLARGGEVGVWGECEPQEEVEDGWCDWVCPKPQGYLMQCCDCELIHEVDFRVVQYEPKPSEVYEVVDDPDLQAQMRLRRRDDISPKKPQQEPVAWLDAEMSQAYTIDELPDASGTGFLPLYTAPPKRDLTCVCGAVWEGETMVHPPRKREWVGLTHPQIHELDWPDGVSFEDILLFVRAIEQALKEKNT